MDVTALCPLPVGIVRWRSGKTLTVIVKATFAMDRDGEARLAAEQEPLHPDVPDPRSEIGELRRASDFAPAKQRADIQIVGHARGAQAGRVAARISVGAWSKRFVPVAPAPGAPIPLIAAYLRTPDGGPERVAPVGPWSAERAALARAGGIDADGLPPPSAKHAVFGYYNAAPRDQQIEALGPDLSITIEGLLPGGPRRVRLPGVSPMILAVMGADATEPVELSCDTLLLDVDREICALTWRGRMMSGRRGMTAAELIVALSSRTTKVTWSRVLAQLHTATRTQAAEAPAQPAQPPQPPRAEDGREAWDDLDETTSVEAVAASSPWDDEPTTSHTRDLLDDAPTACIASDALDDAPTAFTAPRLHAAPAVPLASDALDDAPTHGTPDHDEPAPATQPPAMILGSSAVLERASVRLGAAGAASALPFVQDGGPAPPPPAEQSPSAAHAPGSARGDLEVPPLHTALPVETTMVEPSDPLVASIAPALPFEPSAVARWDEEGTITSASPAGPALPFREAAPASPFAEAALRPPFTAAPPTEAAPAGAPAARPGKTWDERTDTFVLGEIRAALPFQGAEPALPFQSAEPALPFQSAEPALPFRSAEPALPFRSAAVAPSPVRTAEHSTIGVRLARAGGEEAAVAAGRSAEGDLIPLETYAAVKAEIWAGRASVEEILERRGIDEMDFRAYERLQAEALALEARAGRCDTAIALGDSLRSTRGGADQQEEEGEGTIEAYVSLQIEIDRAVRPTDVLAARGIDAGAWQRLRRRWKQRAAADAALGAKLREMLAAARKAPIPVPKAKRSLRRAK